MPPIVWCRACWDYSTNAGPFPWKMSGSNLWNSGVHVDRLLATACMQAACWPASTIGRELIRCVSNGGRGSVQMKLAGIGVQQGSLSAQRSADEEKMLATSKIHDGGPGRKTMERDEQRSSVDERARPASNLGGASGAVGSGIHQFFLAASGRRLTVQLAGVVVFGFSSGSQVCCTSAVVDPGVGASCAYAPSPFAFAQTFLIHAHCSRRVKSIILPCLSRLFCSSSPSVPRLFISLFFFCVF